MTNNDGSFSNGFRYLGLITGLFTATLLISNTLDSKVFMIGSLALPAGITLFPLAYVFGDILTEVYGYARSRTVIWTGFISLVLMVFAYSLVESLPSAPFWKNQAAYELILGRVPRIVAASILAYLFGEFCNSYVLARMKVKMRGRAMPVRFIASTIVGQAADTAVFTIFAFAGVFSPDAIVNLAWSAWICKVIWEILALPLTVPLANYLKRVEKVDYFDDHTQFSPFTLRTDYAETSRDITCRDVGSPGTPR